ncbi:transcription repressor NadR [Clostridium sp. MB40-C1]|uniref:transcription repressor NadR n=1 Tax=Clostridium sp. MB40-C1 TaxID=3070996 RepID=UPI0027E198C0|nr:transcription repressor NadR [Clostridium sp. MB40-C1]WMJ80065.1 transcription repressor NadR [Clostridium sp. MB40-C1]
MTAEERRNYIQKLLIGSNTPQKGQDIAEELNVTRQIIVKDVAILRARGLEIIATPEGYLMPRDENKKIEKILPLCHDRDNIEEELNSIVKYGGVIKDVIIEHPLYGEIKAMLMIKTLYDVESFVKKVEQYEAEPLLALTKGIHLHTIEADTEEIINKIVSELKDIGYLVDEF